MGDQEGAARGDLDHYLRPGFRIALLHKEVVTAAQRVVPGTSQLPDCLPAVLHHLDTVRTGQYQPARDSDHACKIGGKRWSPGRLAIAREEADAALPLAGRWRCAVVGLLLAGLSLAAGVSWQRNRDARVILRMQAQHVEHQQQHMAQDGALRLERSQRATALLTSEGRE